MQIQHASIATPLLLASIRAHIATAIRLTIQAHVEEIANGAKHMGTVWKSLIIVQVFATINTPIRLVLQCRSSASGAMFQTSARIKWIHVQ